MTKFKIGDKVKRTKNTYRDMKIGDIDTILEVSDTGRRITLKKYGQGHSPDSLVFIKTIWRDLI